MGKAWLETVFWPDPPEPPKMLYFEKRANGVILNCQIAVEKDFALVRGDDEEISARFEFGAASEKQAVEYLEQLGYARAADWGLPPLI
jgi:hypothetical protein